MRLLPFICCVLFLTPVFAACTDFSEKKARLKSADSLLMNREVAEDAEITYTDSGLLRARIKAPLMEGIRQAKQPFIEMPKGLNAEFYDTDGSVSSYVTSEYGIYKQNEKTILLRRNVQVMNVKGEKLETEKLIWNQGTAKIYTDEFVKITTADEIIMGDGMTANQNFTNWSIRNVSGTIQLNNDQQNDTSHIVAGGSRAGRR